MCRVRDRAIVEAMQRADAVVGVSSPFAIADACDLESGGREAAERELLHLTTALGQRLRDTPSSSNDTCLRCTDLRTVRRPGVRPGSRSPATAEPI